MIVDIKVKAMKKVVTVAYLVLVKATQMYAWMRIYCHVRMNCYLQ